MSTQKNYIEAGKDVITTQNSLALVRGQLAKLAVSKVTLEQVMEILAGCIELLARLKEQVTNMVKFFNAISNLVEIIVTVYLKDFITGAEYAQTISLNGYTLLDYQKKVSRVLAPPVVQKS